MDVRDVRAYVEREWATAETRKQEHWAREFNERGPDATLEAALTLREHMRLVNPEWPSERERAADLADHIALKRAIDLAAGAFVGLTTR